MLPVLQTSRQTVTHDVALKICEIENIPILVKTIRVVNQTEMKAVVRLNSAGGTCLLSQEQHDRFAMMPGVVEPRTEWARQGLNL